ncbi:MAG: hypothetical protein LC803_08945 [Acidobacteria bacterium]|nr:hypothetical protein [Acidobacteriota bacterium]
MTLQLDPVLDLGRDTDRMTSDDKRRQEATVNVFLRAFSAAGSDRREVQLLADEVGLGKTFVGLATAYSLLQAVRSPRSEVADEMGFRKCYRAVVVVVPSGNHALASKWHQEVEALRTRCSRDARQTNWFHSKVCDNAYDLVEGLKRANDLRRDPRKNPNVLICTANAFRRRVVDPGERLRFLSACLFHWWKNKISQHECYRIISRASEVRGFSSWARSARRTGVGSYDVNLWDFHEHEQYLSPRERAQWNWPRELEQRYQSVPFTLNEILAALKKLEQDQVGQDLLYDESTRTRDGIQEPKGLLPYCKNMAERRGYAEWYFEGFKSRLLALYKKLAPYLLRQDLPLVIVDEAHHWRHSHRQDCQDFTKYLAPFCRRLMMLTATPFQLHRDELLEVLSVGDAMTPAIGIDRVAHLRGLRDRIRETMAASESAGVAFSREWGALTEQFVRLDARFDPANCWLPGEKDQRTSELARWWDELTKEAETDSRARLSLIPGALRPFFARALELQASNEQLRKAMRQLIVRHRRGVAHRRVWVGREYPPRPDTPIRPDQHLLHLAPGSTIPPHAELSQYLLMKVVAEASRGRHRTTLGMDLTGCYSTLWRSKEGIKAIEAAMCGNSNQLLLLLQQVTGYQSSGENNEDGNHPKVRLVVEEVLDRWQRGEKSLIFCFRIPTAETLSRLLSRGVDKRLKKSRRLLFESRGTEIGDEMSEDKAMQQFRRALTAREGSGVSLFLDRILLGWFQLNGLPLPILTEDDRVSIADLYARASHQGIPLQRGERVRPDRVFLNRAMENVWAAKLLVQHDVWSAEVEPSSIVATRRLLEMMADPAWVRFRYGLEEFSRRRVLADGEPAHTDTVARSSLSATYELESIADPATQQRILDALRAKPAGGRASLADTLVSGPNLFVPLGSEILFSLNVAAQKRIREMLQLIFSMTLSNGEWKWDERAKILDAVVRALLREDILLRLPPSVFRGVDRTWAASILRGLHEAPGSLQREPLAARVEEFLRELVQMGPTERESHLRYSMNSKAEAVVLITGDSKTDRDAVFNGFNTPLLPDILICTQVGQEGIDLHRHCSHVVHYDLGWNPATLEQRTGRTDRIGSKALRERRMATEHHKQQGLEPDDAALPGLDIALPYLAGTYDERMFDRLRSRSQAFEILTGGDPTADRENETSWLNPDDIGQADGIDYVPLPTVMLDQLRVNLGVI